MSYSQHVCTYLSIVYDTYILLFILNFFLLQYFFCLRKLRNLLRKYTNVFNVFQPIVSFDWMDMDTNECITHIYIYTLMVDWSKVLILLSASFISCDQVENGDKTSDRACSLWHVHAWQFCVYIYRLTEREREDVYISIIAIIIILEYCVIWSLSHE